jgi:hypothetical protein
MVSTRFELLLISSIAKVSKTRIHNSPQLKEEDTHFPYKCNWLAHTIQLLFSTIAAEADCKWMQLESITPTPKNLRIRVHNISLKLNSCHSSLLYVCTKLATLCLSTIAVVADAMGATETHCTKL